MAANLVCEVGSSVEKTVASGVCPVAEAEWVGRERKGVRMAMAAAQMAAAVVMEALVLKAGLGSLEGWAGDTTAWVG